MKKDFFYSIVVVIMLLTACRADPGEPTQTPGPTGVKSSSTATSIPTDTSTPEPTSKAETTESSQVTPSVPASDAVLLGYYPAGLLRNSEDRLRAFNAWIEPTGKKAVMAGTFLNFEGSDVASIVPAELDAAWENRYIPFVNLASRTWTDEEINRGDHDREIRTWAQVYAEWANNGEKRAFIAPLQEMNGYWTSYGKDPDSFREAFTRIHNIFDDEGVDPKSISWVFAPNGWSQEGREFEKFYPGDEVVDIISFSSYNWGNCSPFALWEDYDDIYGPYLERMHEMAPDKPIFIAELGTVADGGDKNEWLVDTYAKLVEFPNLQGILYFNFKERGSSLENCPNGADYRVFDYENNEGWPGFLEAISIPEIVYYPPQSASLDQIMYSRP